MPILDALIKTSCPPFKPPVAGVRDDIEAGAYMETVTVPV